MGARSGTACQRAASALSGAIFGSGATSLSSACSAASSLPKSWKASNFGFTGAFAASSRVFSCMRCRNAESTCCRSIYNPSI